MRLRRSAERAAAAAPVLLPAPVQSRFGDVFDRVVRALPLGVIMVDRTAHVTFANRAASTIFGFDPSRAVGAHLLQSVPNVELERRVDEALRGEASLAPLIVAGRDAKRTYAVSTYPLPEGDGFSAAGALIFADDQTEAIALARARNDFISNVSHELRTPLASIKLMLETVIESPDDEAGDLFLPQALTQIDRLASLVGRLLEQARAQSGQLQLNLRDVELDSVVQPILTSFEPQAASKGVSLTFRALRPVRVEVDPDRFAQVAVNLVDNALRHTPSGGKVDVEVDAEGPQAIIRVRDTGIGIPYKDLPHIFERFYVVDRSRARDISGAGLGLSIVKQIVDAHGGSVVAASMLGRGTTFTVRVPMMHVKRET